jgi:hypothetical protein
MEFFCGELIGISLLRAEFGFRIGRFRSFLKRFAPVFERCG